MEPSAGEGVITAKPKPYRNVCEVIVANDFCVGCGVCAGVCPARALTMQFNAHGEYIARETGTACLEKCDLCFRACPFWNQADNEDTLAQAAFGSVPNIHHRPETGYYLDAFVGYSNVDGHRANGASGGLATWFLETLLRQGIVDRVVCVVANDDPSKLFKFAVLDQVEGVRRASRSCYYPVELSGVIHEILTTEARYAIIGLPCFLKGLRLAMRMNRRLRERVTVLAGLVCGQTQSKQLAEYLCALGGGNPAHMARAVFRVKDPARPATDHGFRFECQSGPVSSGTVFWSEGMSEAWTTGYFRPGACDFCDDVFAEVADVVFMDAWLPEYRREHKGTNLVLVRSGAVQQVLESAALIGTVDLARTDVERVIASQRGVIFKKRTELACGARRIRNANPASAYLPRKRVEPQLRVGRMDWLLLSLKERIRAKGLEAFNMGSAASSPERVQGATRRLRLLVACAGTASRVFRKARTTALRFRPRTGAADVR